MAEGGGKIFHMLIVDCCLVSIIRYNIHVLTLVRDINIKVVFFFSIHPPRLQRLGLVQGRQYGVVLFLSSIMFSSSNGEDTNLDKSCVCS